MPPGCLSLKCIVTLDLGCQAEEEVFTLHQSAQACTVQSSAPARCPRGAQRRQQLPASVSKLDNNSCCRSPHKAVTSWCLLQQAAGWPALRRAVAVHVQEVRDLAAIKRRSASNQAYAAAVALRAAAGAAQANARKRCNRCEACMNSSVRAAGRLPAGAPSPSITSTQAPA